MIAIIGNLKMSGQARINKNRKNNQRIRELKQRTAAAIELRLKKQFKSYLAVEFSLSYQLNCIVKYDFIESICNRKILIL